MTYRGHVKNGQITLDDPVTLPEGAEVSVEFTTQELRGPDRSGEPPPQDVAEGRAMSSGVPALHGHVSSEEPSAKADMRQGDEGRPTIWDKLLEMAGTIEAPEDWAENHDHYIHGTPKRS